jgi:hypothetical protein
MSGELKSENINKKKPPLDKAIIQQKINSTVPSNITTSQKDIIQRTYWSLRYDFSMNYKDPQDQRPSWITVHS